MASKKLKFKEIKVSKEVQPRVSLDADTVSDYMGAMERGEVFPEMVVFQDVKTYWLACGFHRMEAMRKLEMTEATVEVRKGTKRDAILCAAGDNAKHGHRMTNADKRKVVTMFINDKEWGGWSNRKIAEHTGTSDRLVSSLRNDDAPVIRKYEKNGKEQEMDTSNIGKKPSYTPGNDDRTAVILGSEPSAPATVGPPEEQVPKPEQPKPDDRAKKFRALSVLDRTITLIQDNGWLDDLGEKGEFASAADYLKKATPNAVADLHSRASVITRNLTMSGADAVMKWIDDGSELPKKEVKARPPKGAEDVPQEAWAMLEKWEALIGLPPTEQPKHKYAKALLDIHRLDKQPWEVVEEIIVAVKVCWNDEGMSFLSPIGLRNPVKSKNCKKWESVWENYRKRPDYKPLRPIPKCPECDKKLIRGQISRSNRSYVAYLCKDHPEKSIPTGRKFLPHQLIKN